MLPMPTRSSEGLRLLGQGQAREASAAFAAALEQDPKDLKCLLGLARAQIALGEVPEALATFERLFAVKPDHLEARSHRALLLANQGDSAGLKELEVAASDRKAGLHEHYNYGLYLAGKNDDKAQKEFETALRVEARDPRPYVELGRIAERRNDPRAALRHYQKAAEYAVPSEHLPFVMKSRAHKVLGEGQQAVAAISEAIQRAPRQMQLYEEGYKLCLELKDFENAIRIALHAAEQDSGSAVYPEWVKEATEASKTGGVKSKPKAGSKTWEETDASQIDADEAIKQAEALIMKKPPNGEGALRAIEPILRIRPSDPKANILKALAMAVTGNKAGAVPFAKRAAAGGDWRIKSEAEALMKVLVARK